MKLQPTLDRVAIIKDEEKVTKGGIILPDNIKKKKLKFGIVVAVGPGEFNDDGSRRPMSVKKGDRVVFIDQYPPFGGEILMADDADILAIVKD